jgi:hypothetical protein
LARESQANSLCHQYTALVTSLEVDLAVVGFGKGGKTLAGGHHRAVTVDVRRHMLAAL